MIEQIKEDQGPEQVVNVATLPGIQKASLAMPDIHWGYGFCIGGVAATDPEARRRDFSWRGRLRHQLWRPAAADEPGLERRERPHQGRWSISFFAIFRPAWARAGATFSTNRS